jgi:hypothetical protein
VLLVGNKAARAAETSLLFTKAYASTG